MSGRKQTFTKPMPESSQDIGSQLVDDYDFEDSMEEKCMVLNDSLKELPCDNKKAARKRPIPSTSGTLKRVKQPEYNWQKLAEIDDPVVRAAIKVRVQREAMSSNKVNPCGSSFNRPLQTAVGKDHVNNEADSDQFFHSNYTYRILDLCVRRSRTERYGHYLHFLKLRQLNGDIIFHNRMGIQAEAIPSLIRCLTELQNEIQAYPKPVKLPNNF